MLSKKVCIYTCITINIKTRQTAPKHLVLFNGFEVEIYIFFPAKASASSCATVLPTFSPSALPIRVVFVGAPVEEVSVPSEPNPFATAPPVAAIVFAAAPPDAAITLAMPSNTAVMKAGRSTSDVGISRILSVGATVFSISS